MHLTARQGIISLLPKGPNKDPKYIKNWRPLTLLNYDYKILAKIMATRLKEYLPLLIGPQQTGFLEGRNISDNIRRTLDVLSFATEKRKRWMIMTIDFEKCFDKISYSGLFGAMEYFNIGPNFRRWCKLFFTDFNVCTQNNGYKSDYFIKSRSINQGCNISPYLFLLCSEVMTHKLMENRKIKGIHVNDIRLLISQFADDTILYLNFDLEELNAVIDTFTLIEANLGLKISYDKTTIYRVGSLRGTDARLYTVKNFNWSDGDIELLGVTLPNGKHHTYKGTIDLGEYDKTIEKVAGILKGWMERKLTLIGKILILNTLIAPLFIYKLAVLLPIPIKSVNMLEKVINVFLWGGGRVKIPIDQLQLTVKKTGLKLFDVKLRQEALYMHWLFKIKDSFDYVKTWLLPKLPVYLQHKVNISATHVQKIIQGDTFWKRVMVTWAKYHYKKCVESHLAGEEIIWYNSLLCVGGLPFIWPKCVNAGIIYVSDIYEPDNKTIMSYMQICNVYGKCMTWLEYQQLLHIMPKEWGTVNHLHTSTCEKFLSHEEIPRKKIVKYLYNAILEIVPKGDIILNKVYMRFTKNVQACTIETFINAMRYLYKITWVTKLRSFQYRLLMGKIFTNDILYKWKVKPSPNCEFCDTNHSVKHMLWDGECIQPILTYWKRMFTESLTYGEMITNQLKSRNRPAEVVLLITKFYVYRCMLIGQKPSVENYIMEIRQYKEILLNHEYSKKETALTQYWQEFYYVLGS